MAIKKILVPYDASGYSDKAFNKALELATKFNSTISVLSVISKKYDSTIGYKANLGANILKEQENFATKIVKDLESSAKKFNVPFSFKVIASNSVSKAIIGHANSKKFDLVIIGSHGRTGFRKLVLGSVANNVLQQVKCPVMLVK